MNKYTRGFLLAAGLLAAGLLLNCGGSPKENPTTVIVGLRPEVDWKLDSGAYANGNAELLVDVVDQCRLGGARHVGVAVDDKAS